MIKYQVIRHQAESLGAINPLDLLCLDFMRMDPSRDRIKNVMKMDNFYNLQWQ